MLFAALHESAHVKDFGCRPLEGRRGVFGGRRPKASKGERFRCYGPSGEAMAPSSRQQSDGAP
ncbi:hypothetical protein, partial [Bradyrhizobium sp. UFLA05-112]